MITKRTYPTLDDGTITVEQVLPTYSGRLSIVDVDGYETVELFGSFEEANVAF